jgi:hypothetical protein
MMGAMIAGEAAVETVKTGAILKPENSSCLARTHSQRDIPNRLAEDD